MSSADDKKTGSTGSGTGTGGGTAANACEEAAIWKARNDLTFSSSHKGSAFANALNALVRASDASPLSISNHVEAKCIWKMTLSAPEDSVASTGHSASFTDIFRHPAGLWTMSPQSSGWVRIVDAASHDVWLPMRNVTASATYGASDCRSLSSVSASAVIPRSAGSIAIATKEGTVALDDLLGTEDSTSPPGWNVTFSFSADLTE